MSYSAAKEGKKIVVIGSSFIGMEVVGAVAKRKLASIDVVSMEEVPFQAVLGKEVGAGLKKVCTGNQPYTRARSTRPAEYSPPPPVLRVPRRQVPHAG